MARWRSMVESAFTAPYGRDETQEDDKAQYPAVVFFLPVVARFSSTLAGTIEVDGKQIEKKPGGWSSASFLWDGLPTINVSLYSTSRRAFPKPHRSRYFHLEPFS